MLRLAFDFIITWRETRTRPNAYRQSKQTLPNSNIISNRHKSTRENELPQTHPEQPKTEASIIGLKEFPKAILQPLRPIDGLLRRG